MKTSLFAALALFAIVGATRAQMNGRRFSQSGVYVRFERFRKKRNVELADRTHVADSRPARHDG